MPSSEEAGAKEVKKVRRTVAVKSDELIVPKDTWAICVLPTVVYVSTELCPPTDFSGSSEHTYL